MDKIKMYVDSSGEWRWRRTAPNGEEVAASSEGYNYFHDCRENMHRVNGLPEEHKYEARLDPTNAPELEEDE